MKPFNWKNPTTQKWFLVFGLMLSLGFNLSWNPQLTHFARNEFHTQETEMASSGDLSGIDNSNSDYTTLHLDQAPFNYSCAITVVYPKVDADPNATTSQDVTMMLSGADVCQNCTTNPSLSLTPPQLKNVGNIQFAIAGYVAQADSCKPGASKKDDKGKPAKSDSGFASELADAKSKCDSLDLSSDDGTDCEDALSQLSQACDNAGDKTSCKKEVHNVLKGILKQIGPALGEDPASDTYSNATSMRDLLLADANLSSKEFNDPNGMRDSLMRMTLTGAYQFANSCFQAFTQGQDCGGVTLGGMKLTNQNAAFKAKQLMQYNLTNPYSGQVPAIVSALAGEAGYIQAAQLEGQKTAGLQSKFGGMLNNDINQPMLQFIAQDNNQGMTWPGLATIDNAIDASLGVPAANPAVSAVDAGTADALQNLVRGTQTQTQMIQDSPLKPASPINQNHTLSIEKPAI